MLRTDPAYAARAARVSSLAKDICRISRDGLPLKAGPQTRRASSSPIIPPARCSTASASRGSRRNCSAKLGFVVKDVPEGHLCCGSAGTYNILQPDIARRLRERKVGTIEKIAT